MPLPGCSKNLLSCSFASSSPPKLAASLSSSSFSSSLSGVPKGFMGEPPKLLSAPPEAPKFEKPVTFSPAFAPRALPNGVPAPPRAPNPLFDGELNGGLAPKGEVVPRLVLFFGVREPKPPPPTPRPLELAKLPKGDFDELANAERLEAANALDEVCLPSWVTLVVSES